MTCTICNDYHDCACKMHAACVIGQASINAAARRYMEHNKTTKNK